MHPFPVPAAAVFCSAMLLLTHLASSTTDAVNTTSPCAPAACGSLTITYPFWLSGKHPPECGRRAFQVMCNQSNVFLKNSYWTYQILDILYQNSSFRVTNVDLSDGTCDFGLYVNASTDLGLSPFTISPRNQELFFLYNCSQQAPQVPTSWAPVSCASEESFNSFAWLAGKYKPGDIWRPLPVKCIVSMMPVLGYEGAAGDDHERLMKGGFLLNYTAGDCSACMESGGRCRTNVIYDEFECHCSDGVSPEICSKFVYG